MRIAARIGVVVVVVVTAVLATGGWYLWQRPLEVYAWMNRRALSSAGLSRQQVATPFGPQRYWTGGQGPTLVLLHGAGDQAGTWANVVESLVARYRLVVPDLAGHGESDPLRGPITIGHVLRGVEAVLEQGDREPAIIVGNSLGAWIALLYAHAHPDRVLRLVLVNGGALKGDRPDLSLTPKSRDEAARLLTQLRDPSAPQVQGFILDDIVREAQTGALARLSQSSSEMEQYLLEGRLEQIAAPVDLLWGESDKLFPLTYARRMMESLPASRLTTIPRCGHVPQQECPSRFRASLFDILQSAPPTRPVRNAQAR